jgi:type II secretory pathway pseudopilin PulG
MVVIAIIGVLAAALFPSLTGYIERATFTGQLKGMVDMNTAIQAYFIDKSVYPSSIALGWNNPYGCYASPV